MIGNEDWTSHQHILGCLQGFVGPICEMSDQKEYLKGRKKKNYFQHCYIAVSLHYDKLYIICV